MTASDYAAAIRVFIPAIIGLLLKPKDADYLNYKDAAACSAGYSIEPFKSINDFENSFMTQAGVLFPVVPVVKALLIGTIVSAILAAWAEPNVGSRVLCVVAKKEVALLQAFTFDLTVKEWAYVIGVVVSAVALELAASRIDQTTGFDPSGHFTAAIASQLLNSFALRVLARVDFPQPLVVAADVETSVTDLLIAHDIEPEPEPTRHSKVATNVTLIASLLLGINLIWTANKCHSALEVGAAFIPNGLLMYGAAHVLAHLAEVCHQHYQARAAAPTTESLLRA